MYSNIEFQNKGQSSILKEWLAKFGDSTFRSLYKMMPLIGVVSLIVTQVSCKKLVETSPPVTSLTEQNVYQNDATAISVLTGIYINNMNGGITSGQQSISVETGLSSDELTMFGTQNINLHLFYINKLTNASNLTYWEHIYSTLVQINSALEGLTASTTLTPAVKQQLLGEAKFLRALHYFYLVNLYGDVPLVITTNYQVNLTMSRTPKAIVWQQIISDLKDAQNMLSSNYLDGTLLNATTERVRPTKWAATALLARAYLYQQQWADAAVQATTVINNSTLYSLDTLNGVFLKNSNEAIWQIQPTAAGFNTYDAPIFVLTSGPSAINPVYLSHSLINAFEPGDGRFSKWIGVDTSTGTKYYYPYKYKNYAYNAPLTEYMMVLRLGEQYLIRAEAEANGASGDPVADLNVIRNRAGLPNYTGATDKVSLLTAIQHERQVELFTEWGNRWLDLKRTGNVDVVMGPGGACAAKGGIWNTNWQLYPLPFTDIKYDANLKQNPGY